MKMKRVIWLLISCLVVAGITLASCGPAAEEEEEEEQPAVEEPQYGGTLKVAIPTDITVLDLCVQRGNCQILGLTHEMTTGGNWAHGPAGTGEIDFLASGYHGLDHIRGILAESWEFPELGTFILNIRRGVHWQTIPGSEASELMGGREFTADDLIYNIERYRDHPESTKARSQPGVYKDMTVEKIGDWSVKVRSPHEPFTSFVFHFLGYTPNYPPEVLEEYGDVTDWHNFLGTGPFMLTDFVKGSSATLTRNPDYWDKDPVGPGKGNQLPYVDEVKVLIITDASTRQSAIRTSQIDWLTNVVLEDARSLQLTTPDLMYQRRLSDRPYMIGMRTDLPELPFDDVRVRQALMMATDFFSIRDDYYLGEAQILNFPTGPHKGLESVYIPLDELPESARTLYDYNPEKAKELLDDAGYADGFTARVICETRTEQIDYLSLIKDMWAKIGVTLVIEPKDPGVFAGLVRTYDEMRFQQTVPTTNTYNDLAQFKRESYPSFSLVEDAYVREKLEEMKQYYLIDHDRVHDIFREDLFAYLVEQAYYIEQPTPYEYTFWWPWIKNYHGEAHVNYSGWDAEPGLSWTTFVWLDQDMREEETGSR